MENLDAPVLCTQHGWCAHGQRALSAMAACTWGSAPRPVELVRNVTHAKNTRSATLASAPTCHTSP